MNWLAHFALSSGDGSERLGNWIPDLFGPAELAGVTDPGVRRGMALHRVIDRTTDRHPRMRRALTSLPPELRRGGGILLDVFWDHFLARDFPDRMGRPLASFVTEVLDSLDAVVDRAPPGTRWVLERMRSEDWLGGYGTTAGVELALNRISRRLSPRVRRVLVPDRSAAFLEEHRGLLQDDFESLWADVCGAVRVFRESADGEKDVAKPSLA
ncbi:MAG: ACP phosphodiesterase [Verrucomicrobiota bacterium]